MLESATLHNETVMHRSVHLLACAAVVLHIMVGCCWHHAHAACPGECRGDSPTVACRPCGENGHGEHHACPGQKPQGGDRGCDAAPCEFVVPKTGSPTCIAPARPLGLLPREGGAARPARPLAARPDGASSSRVRADLRLHLVNQVLLL